MPEPASPASATAEPHDAAPPTPRAGGAASRAPFLAAGATVVAALIPPLAVLVSGHTLAWRDTARLIGSFRPSIEASLRAFHLPLWTPHEELGLPLLAQLMHGVLHPVSVLSAFVAPGSPLDLQILAHVALAAGGAWLLARTLGTSPWAAAVAGLTYALSGYVLGMSGVLTYLAGAGAAPWAIAGLRLAATGRRGGVAGAALGVAAVAFAGDPQWTIVVLALGAILAAEAAGWAGLGRAVLGGALGGLLAAVQLVPALAFFPQTARATAVLSAYERALWAFPPARVLELVLPGLFNGIPGSGVAPVFRALGGDVGRHTTSFVPSVFIGAVPIALAVAGAAGSRVGRALAASSAVLLWLALGVNAGAVQLLGHVPVWGAFRYSEKLVGPLTLSVAVLAALGADRLSRAPRASARRTVVALAVLAAIVLAVAWVPGLADAVASTAAAEELRRRASIGVVHLVVALGLVAAVAAAARRWGRGIMPAAAAAAIWVQSLAASPFALHAGGPGAVDRTALRALATPGEVARIATPVLGAPVRGHEELDDADRVAAVQSRLGASPYSAAEGVDQLDCYSGFSSVHFDRFTEAVVRDLQERSWEAWRRLGLSHVLAQRALLPGQVRTAMTAVAGGTKVLEDEDWGYSAWALPHRPWASFAPGVVPAASDQEAYAAFVSQVSLERPEVVVEGGSPGPRAPGRVLAVDREGGRVRIEAEADGDALLVVNDAWWPGWIATIDGRPAPILRADVIVRAVPFPPGRHLLEMRYDPREVRIGIAASAAGAVIVLALLGLAARRRPTGDEAQG